MGGDRAGQPFEVVAALQQRDDAPAACRSAISISFRVAQAKSASVRLRLAERIAPVSVEPGRDDDQVGPERLDPRQDRGSRTPRGKLAAVARPQRRVDDGVVLAALARPRRCPG